MHYAMLATAIASEVIATLMLKASDGLTRWTWTAGSLFFYAIAGVLLSLVLRHMAVGIAYAIWAGTGIALICLASAVLLGQRFDLAAAAGIVLIGVGVLLITLKSSVVLQ